MSYVTLLHNIGLGELKHFFVKMTFLTPVTPIVKLLITFVATHPLVILTKFGQNPIKHVEEETNCEKKEEKGGGGRKKPQERNKLGEPPNLRNDIKSTYWRECSWKIEKTRHDCALCKGTS